MGGVTSWTEGACSSNGCINETLIDPNAPCPFIFAPVCGCDGVTYDNACIAETQGGVISWTEGACTVETCQDLAGVDFGECDFVLGIAQINGVCTTVSGCDYVVNGVDYTHSFQDEPTCTMCNEVPPSCELELLVSSEDGMFTTSRPLVRLQMLKFLGTSTIFWPKRVARHSKQGSTSILLERMRPILEPSV